MLDRGVARHEVEEEAQPARVAGLDERVEVVERPVLGRDVGVVADVVPEVVERGGIHRREPDGIDAEGGIGPAQVVEAIEDAAQVADAVAVRIGVAAGVDLVDDGPLPPAVGGGLVRVSHGDRFYGLRPVAVGVAAYNPALCTERGDSEHLLAWRRWRNNTMRHRWMAAPIAALILVTACQGGGDDASPGGDGESPGAGGGTEIDEASISGEVRLSGGRSSDAEEALLEETLAAFSEAYPDIEVIYEPIPEAYVENMIGQFSTGDPPDLFYVGATGEAAPWIEDELLLPLDDYIAGNPEIGLEHFYPGLLAPFQRDGSTYGLPKDASPLALFVNPDMLADAGVEIPTNWDELEAAAEALTSDDVTGLCLGAEIQRWGAFIYQNGGALYNEDLSEMTLDSPETVEALDYLLGLHEDGDDADAGRDRRQLVRRGVRHGAGGHDHGGQLARPGHGQRLPRHAVRDGGAAAGRAAGQPGLHRRLLDGRRFAEQGPGVGAAAVPVRSGGDGAVDEPRACPAGAR